METLKEILMSKFDLDEKTADDELSFARELVENYIADGDFASAEDVMADQFGLEPDYVLELMGL